MMKKIIETKNAPAPIGPYSQAILINNTLYTSGQIAIDPTTGNLNMSSIDIETHQVMNNIKAILSAANMHFNDVVKTSIFLNNMNDFGSVNAIYGSYFKEEIAPARETVQVAGLPKNVNVEISVIAIK